MIIKLLKKIFTAFGMIYSYNLIVPSALLIPINIMTITFLTIFSVPGLVILIIIKQIII